jgi:hypothetical protein
MAKINLTEAKQAKNDEFYTQYADIEKEITAYLEFDPDVFWGKTVLLPCDDPEWSNFTKYFAQNFDRFGLRKLISTSYAVESKTYKGVYQPTLFEMSAPYYDKTKTTKNGKIFTLTHDKTGDHKVNVDDLEWHYLKGDGDFRSAEIKALRDEADVIITNPPFSLFREFLAWIIEVGKQFVIIGNMNAITYKELFPFLKEDKIWLGVTNFNTGMYFKVPSDFVYADSYKFEREQNGDKVNRVPGVCWFTNLDHGRRHQPLPLMTMSDNLKYSKHKEIKGKKSYYRYDNYDALDVPFTDSIPSDYDGVMGVPISFLDKYCPEQFEILGLSRYTKTQGMSKKFVDAYYKSGQTGAISEGHPDLCYYDHNNKPVVPYMRVLIKLKKGANK